MPFRKSIPVRLPMTTSVVLTKVPIIGRLYSFGNRIQCAALKMFVFIMDDLCWIDSGVVLQVSAIGWFCHYVNCQNDKMTDHEQHRINETAYVSGYCSILPAP
jgi:hypothetical protein